MKIFESQIQIVEVLDNRVFMVAGVLRGWCEDCFSDAGASEGYSEQRNVHYDADRAAQVCGVQCASAGVHSSGRRCSQLSSGAGPDLRGR